MDFVREYFGAEKTESLLFVAVGLITAFLALYFWLGLKKPFYSGMAYPFLFVAVLQIVVGGTVFLRSDKDTERVEKYVRHDKPQIGQTEIPRMKTVMKNFMMYRYLYFVLLVAAVLLMFYIDFGPVWKGVGIGLFIQTALMLAADYFAETRGAEYLQALERVL